jgi:hypothetical protein
MVTPTSELKLQVGGTVNPRTGVYIIRPSDAELLALLERGEYANVLCSRQMGKSSLLVRTKARLHEKGYATAAIDVAGYLGTMNDVDGWYQGLLQGITRQLRLDVDVTGWWAACRAVTPNQRLIQFFRDEVAAKTSAPVVIFLDEIDCTIQLPYTDDFFVAIRAMYNDRASEPLFEKVAFCLVGVATPNELIKDRRTTPYNIGQTIELEDFDPTRDDLSPLYRAVSSDEATGQAVVQNVLSWTGGHPYLTVLVCEKFIQRICRVPEEVGPLINEMFTSLDELRGDIHFETILRFISQRVEDALVTLNLYRRIRRGEEVRDQTSPAHIALKLAGIVKRNRQGRLVVRNRIYHRLFTDEWAVRTAEADTKAQVEMQGWKTAAAINEKTLREVLDDYGVAFSQYQSLLTNPTYNKHDADELWAEFFERRALRAEQQERRDEALLWQLRALAVQPTDDRARAVGELISLDYPQLVMSFRHSSGVNAVAFSADGRWVVTGSMDEARLWRAETGEPVGQPMRHDDAVRAVAFSPDGRTVVTGSDDKTARLWRAETGEPVGQPIRRDRLVNAVAFSPDGRTVVTGSSDQTARLWRAETGEPVGQPMRHDDAVRAVAFSPDGRTVVTGSDDKTARLWRAGMGEPVGQPMRHDGVIWAVAFSPDGRTVVTGSDDKTARLWRAETGEPVGQPIRHDGGVRAVAFSPDGRTVMTGSYDKMARLWRAETGEPVGQPIRHGSWVNAVAFSPDGRMVLTGSADGTARLWRVDAEQPGQSLLDQGDPTKLLEEWQKKLALRINDAGEIVPMYQ